MHHQYSCTTQAVKIESSLKRLIYWSKNTEIPKFLFLLCVYMRTNYSFNCQDLFMTS